MWSDIRQAVLSNWPPSRRPFLEHHRLSRYLSAIVASGEEQMVKPDPALFRRAVERLDATPERTVCIGNDAEA
ncbi:MAG: HAD hydrolase-like protein, partial [Armatimonadetes bacterium]|nr:HAD hydrolase-like protein [Armatimonadota bacterium]